MNLVSVLCDAPGFRRAGRAWPASSVVDMDDFSQAEQQAIAGEAHLHVRVLSDKEKDLHLEGVMQTLGETESPKSTTPPSRAPLKRRGTKKKTARKAS